MPQRPSIKAKLLPGDGPFARVSPLLAFLLVAALFAVGVIVGGLVGAAVLGVLALALAGLLAATWGALHPSQRAGRVAVVLVLAALAVVIAVR